MHLVAYLHVRAGNHIQAMKTFVEYVDKLISNFLKFGEEKLVDILFLSLKCIAA